MATLGLSISSESSPLSADEEGPAIARKTDRDSAAYAGGYVNVPRRSASITSPNAMKSKGSLIYSHQPIRSLRVSPFLGNLVEKHSGRDRPMTSDVLPAGR